MNRTRALIKFGYILLILLLLLGATAERRAIGISDHLNPANLKSEIVFP